MIAGRERSWRAWLVLCVLGGSGCDSIFRIDHVSVHDSSVAADGATDGATDGAVQIDAAAACATPTFYEPFVGGVPCSQFPTTYKTNTEVIQSNGILRITPDPLATTPTVGGCNTPQNNYNFGAGLTAIVDQALVGSGSYTVLLARGANSQIKVGGGMLRFQTAANVDIGPAIAYSPVMKWWRIRPGGVSTIVGEYSIDSGESWQLLGQYNVVPPATIGVEITGGSTTGGNVATAIFDQVMICP